MNLVNLTNEQYQTVLNIFMQYVQKLINRVQKRVNQHITPEFVIQLILFMYRSRYDRQSMQRLAVYILNQGIRSYNLDFITDLLHGRNLLGLFLRQENITKQPSYIVNSNKISLIHDQNIYKLLTQKFFNIQWSIVLDQKINEQQMKFNVNSSKFMRRYLQYSNYNWRVQLVKEWRFDKEFIDKECKTLQKQKVKSYREQAIVTLYAKQLNEIYSYQKCNYFQLIQYLFTISDKKFEEEFEVKNEEDVNMLVKFVKEYDVHNPNELKMKASIVKHVEYSEINFNFSDKLKLEDIPDDAIINMLDNIENRIQIIGGSYRSQYIIIRRLSDNKIMKCMITDNNQQEINNMLQQCNDGNVYDVVISSYDKYENVQNVRMRYLNYNGPPYKLTLNHPEDLVSLSTRLVKISNMNQCINLKNLCSEWNTYTKQDIEQLHNLKRIYSSNDKYDNQESCLLNYLFRNNKLEYVYIDDGQNIQLPMLLKQNIKNLRFCNADKIKLDISSYCNNVNSLYDSFLKKYIYKQDGYQDINFYNRQWIIQQITRDEYIRYKQLTFDHDPFDPLSYKARMMNIFLQNHRRQKQEEMLTQLINDVSEYYAVAQLNTQQMLDVADVDNLVQLKNYMIFINNSANNDFKSQVIKHLCIGLSDYIQTDYDILQFMQQLIKLDVETFKKEFYIENKYDVETLINCLIDYQIYNNLQLRQMSAIYKYLEYKQIDMNFNDNFKLEDIPDDILIHLFDNICDRIQRIDGNKDFIIIHRVSDDKILNSMITDKNQQQIEKMLQQCNDNQVYDVIIRSDYKYENLKNIRIRYLNCHQNDNTFIFHFNKNNSIELTLNHPEDLISLSTFRVKISNMNQCTNLRNLYCYFNTYNSDDIVSLKNLRRIYSIWDKYDQNDTCFLQDLFKSNKLEYVYIYNGSPNSNIVNSLVIQDKIEKLRYIYVHQNGDYDIKLNVNQTTPENLYVFDVDTMKDGAHKFGTIQGKKNKINEIKQSLIHQLQENLFVLDEVEEEANQDEDRLNEESSSWFASAS